MYFEYILATYRFRQPESLGIVGIEDHLHQSLAVTQVDENDPAMIAPTVYPAAKVDFLAQMSFGYFSTAVATHD